MERITQNHRMVGVGRDLCGSSSPTLLPKQGHLQWAVEDHPTYCTLSSLAEVTLKLY